MTNRKESRKDHYRFETDIEKLLSRDSTKALYILLGCLCALIIGLVIWASFAVVEEAAVGDGKVIPSSKLKRIQSLDGGIVEEILVKEGQHITRDQATVVIDDTQFKANLEKDKAKLISLTLKVIRLEAEIAQQPKIVWPKRYQQYTELLKVQEDLFNARVKNVRNKVKMLNERIDLLSNEINLKEAASKTGAISKVELLQLKRKRLELGSERNQSLADFIQKAHQELTETTHELKEIEQSVIAKRDQVSRTILRSPVDGIVKTIHVNSVGQVIKSGEDVLDVVPSDDRLVVEVKISPIDIGFIAVGQKANIKVSAYDFSIYGGLSGKVQSISADSFSDEQGHTYYLVQVITDKNYLTKFDKKFYIIPGMIVTANVLTGKKTVMQYLLKPLTKTVHNAFHER